MPPSIDPTSPPRLPRRYTITRHTQKVNGLLALKSLSRWSIWTLPILGLFHRGKWHMHDACHKFRVNTWHRQPDPEVFLPAFVRPCPVRPRHGFVESRKITQVDDLLTLAAETLKADPKGQVMITPVVGTARLNAVWTPSALTLGAGNDGATAGKNVVIFPLSGEMPKDLVEIFPKAGVGPDEDPYIEAVWFGQPMKADCSTGLTLRITQLRAGPKGAVLGDYIPDETLVRRVVPARGDLLEWETLLQHIEPGTVIHHPGGSPTDHYSAHARTFRVPVVFGPEPVIGTTLAPTAVPTLDPAAVLEGIVCGQRWLAQAITPSLIPPPYQLLRAVANYMLVGFHHSQASGGVNASRILGMSIIFMLKLGYAAAMAESRYEKRYRRNEGHRWHKISREAVWGESFPVSLTALRVKLNHLINIHRWGTYNTNPGSLDTPFGGPRWAQCALSLVDLINGIRALSISPTDETLRELIRAMNIAVNQAHNGGWWMGKFTEKSMFEAAQVNDLLGLDTFTQAIWKFGSMLTSPIDTSRERRIWSKWSEMKWDPWLLTQPATMELAKANWILRYELGYQLIYFSTPAINDLLKGAPVTLTQVGDVFTLKVGDRVEWTSSPLTTQSIGDNA